MTYHTMPQDQGQMVTVSYASDGEFLYRRVSDASDGGKQTIERVSWEWLSDSITGEFEPWNGQLGVNVDESDWEAVAK